MDAHRYLTNVAADKPSSDAAFAAMAIVCTRPNLGVGQAKTSRKAPFAFSL
jgi:hypothetical protein